LDWTPNTNHTGIYVALYKGWYKDEGITLKLLPYSESVTPDTLVYTGKADLGISFTESVVADSAANQPVVSIAAIIAHNTSELAVRKDSGISSPRQLDNKIYGGFGAPYEYAEVGAVLKHSGGTGQFKDVTLNIDPIEALKSKRVDFVWIYAGWEAIEAQEEGLPLTVFPLDQNGIPDYPTPNIITSAEMIKNKAPLLKKFMVATTKGYTFAEQHPKAAAKILIQEALPGTFPNTALVYASQAYLSPRYQSTNQIWGLQTYDAWNNYTNFMISRKGELSADGKPVSSINVKSLYTNQYIE
jgi:ABC-type nitrate/sulfonate/bicarbonate transport system substrate-binding protein